MSYDVRQISQIETKNIKLGKTFKYSIGNDSNYNLTNMRDIRPNYRIYRADDRRR